MLFYEGPAPSLFVRLRLCFETKCLKKNEKLYLIYIFKYKVSFILKHFFKTSPKADKQSSGLRPPHNSMNEGKL